MHVQRTQPQGIESLIVVLVLKTSFRVHRRADNPKAIGMITPAAFSGLFRRDEQRKRNMQSELKRMSYCDDLTGLHNRNSYISVLQKLEKSPIRSASFCGSQWVKRINDQQGHDSATNTSGTSAGYSAAISGETIFPYWRETICLPLPNIRAVLCEDLRAQRGQ